jgi:hypothetical protein
MVFWSADEKAFVSICLEFPELSVLELTPERALKEMISLVSEVAK